MDSEKRPSYMEFALRNLLLVPALLISSVSVVFAQAKPAASRLFDLQVGGGYSYGSSDYLPNKFRGLAFYSTIDFRANYGINLDFHQLDDPNPTQTYERTYEVGGRYMRHYNIFTPYLKGNFGRGVFNYPLGEANLAYNMLVAGGGVDIAVHPRINVRADFEFQHWFGFPPNGLAPKILTIGAAYHFPAGKPKGPRYSGY